MGVIRAIKQNEIDRLITLVANAYPSFEATREEVVQPFREQVAATIKEPGNSHFYGYYRDEQMLGIMRLYDYTVHWHGSNLIAGGVGSIAVDLLHKKEKIAKELVTYFLRHYRNQGAHIAFLYSFRPDFYKRMGFGFGTEWHEYRITPSTLPNGQGKERLTFLTEADIPDMLALHRRVTERTHGMIAATDQDLKRLFSVKQNRIVGYVNRHRLQGYMGFQYRNNHSKNDFHNDLHVNQWIAEDPAAHQAFFAFLRSQSDQFQRIVFYVQDPEFHHLFDDPRNDTYNMIPPLSHEVRTTGIGLMVRILDAKRALSTSTIYPFGNVNATFTFEIRDTFLAENEQRFTITFTNGKPALRDFVDEAPVVRMDISDLSALLYGAVSLNTLLNYGKATLSDAQWTQTLRALFPKTDFPVCDTFF
ncbi:putative acetyltransferase [Laceyella sacchari]|uniref:GNAT family N-acetyltransferase n=1 Tax=Laceyella sacchari TaxID=37482 RepID=UPI0010D07C1B|nr:GNAT family N-acetyltransferase [Laceyella sacchari]TCW41450.1 putative acetyltransferase [Laceyella sacchari]